MVTKDTALLVKELRERTGAGMLDCKKALLESGSNLEKAIDWLRQKGLAAAAKKGGRCAAEGLVCAKVDGSFGIVLEVNTETDFVARNEDFQKFVSDLATLALDKKITRLEALGDLILHGQTVQDALSALIARVGESMHIRRLSSLKVNQGIVSPYVHGAIVPGMGRIGVLVALESPAAQDAHLTALKTCGHHLAMHIAAAAPQFLSITDIDTTTLDRERTILKNQAQSSGRPLEVVEKMVEGRLRKYFEDIVLMEQTFVMDPGRKVKQVIADFTKKEGLAVQLEGFIRFHLGEGVVTQESNFAQDVRAQLK